MIVSIHQPMYLPYLGIFNKIKNSDAFVFLDDVAYSTGYFYNRNKIKTPVGEQMLTVPLNKQKNCKLNEITISDNFNWAGKHLKALDANYNKSDFYDNYRSFFLDTFTTNWNKLHDLNMYTFLYLLDQLDINVPFYFSSQMNLESMGAQRLVDICNQLDADTYLSGISGSDYIDEQLFFDNNIQLTYQSYKPVPYKQLWGKFVPNLSVIDALFNIGEDTKNLV